MITIPAEIVSLYRAGSGTTLVNSGVFDPNIVHKPFEEWCRQITMATKANYGKMQLIVTAPSLLGYSDYHGCTIIFLPGDKDGIIKNVNGRDVKVRESLPNKLNAPISAIEFPGNLTLNFGFEDLKCLHTALEKIMDYNKKTKEKI